MDETGEGRRQYPPGQSAGGGISREEFGRRMLRYTVIVTLVLVALGVGAAAALMFYWSASIEPELAGERVLEELREADGGAPDASSSR